MEKPIIIIGAGAAGLAAAIRAAELGAPVVVLEKMAAPGRKILITGAGRCNVTNQAPLDSFVEHYFGQGRFLYPAFRHFFRPELLKLLQMRQVGVITEPSGKIFPASGQAMDVVQALYHQALDCGARFWFQEPVQEVVRENDRITAVRTGKQILAASSVVLTAGGSSWPSTGSSGDSYRLAEAIGHHIIPTRPALVPLISPIPAIRRLSGLSCPNVDARLLAAGRPAGKSSGDLLFTHFGLSGPAILRLSRDYLDIAPDEGAVELNLLPHMTPDEVIRMLEHNCQSSPRRQLANVLGGEHVAQALIQSILEIAGIPSDIAASQVSRSQIARAAQHLQRLVLPVTGTRGYREAMVTAGGIDLREIDPRSMASKINRGLYAAGEALDLDGDTGGYNLQAAFSTGWLAGEQAAQTWLSSR